MQKLTEAMSILGGYGSEGNLCAEHDVLYLDGPEDVSDAHAARLKELGVHWHQEVESWGMFT